MDPYSGFDRIFVKWKRIKRFQKNNMKNIFLNRQSLPWSKLVRS